MSRTDSAKLPQQMRALLFDTKNLQGTVTKMVIDLASLIRAHQDATLEKPHKQKKNIRELEFSKPHRPQCCAATRNVSISVYQDLLEGGAAAEGKLIAQASKLVPKMGVGTLTLGIRFAL